MEMDFWKITYKQRGFLDPVETEFLGNVDKDFLIDHYNLQAEDVEWFKLEKSKNKRMVF